MGIYEDKKSNLLVRAQDLTLDETKAVAEMIRHLATLSSVVIVVLVSMHEKFPKDYYNLLIASMLFLLATIFFSVFAQGLVFEPIIAKAVPELYKKRNPLPATRLFVAIAHVSFALGIGCLVIYGILIT